MPCCGSSDESRECCREQSLDALEQVKAADDNEAAKTVHAERNDERTKKRGCGCQC